MYNYYFCKSAVFLYIRFFKYHLFLYNVLFISSSFIIYLKCLFNYSNKKYKVIILVYKLDFAMRRESPELSLGGFEHKCNLSRIIIVINKYVT